MPEENKTPLEEAVEQAIDQALDLFLYAPLGLALVARDQLPTLIERGRKQVAAQTTLARMMGQYAAKEGEKRLRKRADEMTQRQASPRASSPPNARPAPGTSDATDASERTPAGASAPAAPKPTGDHLAIPGYDTLSASQVVQRLPGLQRDELDAVRAYEEATRGRRTILTKIHQLQADAASS